MGSRRRAREYALQALYQSDLSEVAVLSALNHLWSTQVEEDGMEGARPAESEEIEFAQRLVTGVEADKIKLDGLIEEASTNWRINRMPIVDRNILRLAAFELLNCPDIPASVSVNEAVELAKKFGTAESRAFVNGIVDRLGRNTGRIDKNAKRKHRKS